MWSSPLTCTWINRSESCTRVCARPQSPWLMLCPIKRLGLEQRGSTAWGDLSCKMKAGTSDLLLTNEREREVIYGANWGNYPLAFQQRCFSMGSGGGGSGSSSPSEQHQLDICLQSCRLHKCTWTLCHKHTLSHRHTERHISTHTRARAHAMIMSVATLDCRTDHALSLQSFRGISRRSYVTTPSSPDRMQLHKKAIGSEAILKRQLPIDTLRDASL